MINRYPTTEQKDTLWQKCIDFIEKQEIGCAETIYQTDWVIENAYEFVQEVCDIVGYQEYEDEE